MLPRALPLVFALASCAFGQGPDLIPKMREAAIHYADQLQDFLCTQMTTRSIDEGSGGRYWKLLETRELELGYIAHKEHYRLLKVNGKTSDLEKRIKKGYFRPGGEFGTSLMRIFDPKAAAEFKWDHEESNGGQRTCVFRYRVPRTTTTMIMHADADRIPFAHHGFVSADCESGAVTHIHIESEPASFFRDGRLVPVGEQIDVRYGPTAIAAKEFLLPQQAVEIVLFYKTLTKVEIQFQQYRKYDSSSNITFDKDPAPL